jgi:large subunit ribosomal protein L23
MTTIYNVLRRPLVTEKSNYQNAKLHQYVFEVSSDATKVLVKDAIEQLFNVTVMRVNIMNMPAKRGRNARNRKIISRRSAFKKAIVTLAADDTIAVFEGVK